jgi:hypothetical protein
MHVDVRKKQIKVAKKKRVKYNMKMLNFCYLLSNKKIKTF